MAGEKDAVRRGKERATMNSAYHYLRNGAFFWRWPERVWVLDRAVATVFASWQRAGGPLGTTWRPTMRWQRAGKRASETQHTGVQSPMK